MDKRILDILTKSKAIIDEDTKNLVIEEKEINHKLPDSLTSKLSEEKPLSKQAIKESNLPENIKKAMIDNYVDFTPKGISEDVIKQINPTNKKTQEVQKTNSNYSGLSEETIRLIVKDEISKVLSENLNEGKIKKVFLSLIKEGKIKINKKL